MAHCRFSNSKIYHGVPSWLVDQLHGAGSVVDRLSDGRLARQDPHCTWLGWLGWLEASSNADIASADIASADIASGDDASGDDASGDDASGDDAPADDASGDDASGDDAPGDDAPGDDAPGDEASGAGAVAWDPGTSGAVASGP